MAKSLIPATAKVSLEELSKRIAESGQQELRVIIKGDVQGSVEAVADALAKLSTEKVRLSVIHAARRRDHRGRRQPRHRVQGDHHRLQRAPGRQGCRARGREQDRDSPLLDHLQRARRRAAARWKASFRRRSSRSRTARPRSAQIFKVKGVGRRRLLRHEGKIKRSGKARLLRDGADGLGRQDRGPEALQGRRQARSWRASSAASASTASPTSRRRTSSSATRSRRSSRGCEVLGGRERRDHPCSSASSAHLPHPARAVAQGQAARRAQVS